jgi:hypothetical protein
MEAKKNKVEFSCKKTELFAKLFQTPCPHNKIEGVVTYLTGNFYTGKIKKSN